MKDKEILVPINWLTELAKLAKQAQKEQDEWYETTKPLMPSVFSSLIGYASSAEAIVKYNVN